MQPSPKHSKKGPVRKFPSRGNQMLTQTPPFAPGWLAACKHDPLGLPFSFLRLNPSHCPQAHGIARRASLNFVASTDPIENSGRMSHARQRQDNKGLRSLFSGGTRGVEHEGWNLPEAKFARSGRFTSWKNVKSFGSIACDKPKRSRICHLA